jgi:hypothetical protein
MTWNKKKIQSLVERYLEKHQPRYYHLASSKVVRDGDYWYVLVEPDKSTIRAFDYSKRLADTEEDIRDNEKNAPNLLLVPVLPTDPEDR